VSEGLRKNFAEINLLAVERNFLALHSALKDCALAPMLKADAYGHGSVQVAKVCERLGAKYLGVALIEEGIELRQAGIRTPILVFSSFDQIGAEALVENNLCPIVSTFDEIAKLKRTLHQIDNYPVHIKINTGMQRLGFQPSEIEQVIDEFKTNHSLKLEGVCTHFISSEDFAQKGGATQSQITIFKDVARQVRTQIKTPVFFHYMNSAAILSGLHPRFDLARPGIALYGAYPKLCNSSNIRIEPVLSLKSEVALIHRVKAGETVSYGGAWRAERNTVVAVIPFGYADGLPRACSNKGRVLIKGEHSPIVGMVCMEYFMADITNLAEKNISVSIGDQVTIIGTQKNNSILVEDVAEIANTIPHEILSRIPSRIPRKYIY